MKNNCKVQDVGQKLVDPADKLRRESAQRKKDQREHEPKVATVKDRSISEKSNWEVGTESPLNNRHFGRTLVHAHAKDSSSGVPAPTAFESDINHDPRERSSGRRLRKS